LGIGFEGFGAALSWNALKVDEQGAVSAEACWAWGPGACVGLTNHVDKHGEMVGWPGIDLGIAAGVLEFEPTVGYNVWSLDMRQSKSRGEDADKPRSSWFPPPIPPSWCRSLVGTLCPW
jgi:hypothetical protein